MTHALRLPTLEGLQAFELCARLGSFEQASIELDITSSAITKRITAVEELVGTPLFYRSSRKLILTPDGIGYLADVRIALAQLSRIASNRLRQQRGDRLIVAMPSAFARNVVVPRLPQFDRSQSGVDVEIVTGSQLQTADTGTPDIEISLDIVRSGFGRLLFEPVFPLCTPSYLRGLGEPKLATDIGRGHLLSCSQEPWQPWFVAAGITLPEPHRGPKFSEIELALEAAASGQGIALGRKSLAQSWLKRGELVTAFPVFALSIRGFCIRVMNPNRAATAFAAWIQVVCEQLEKDSLKK